MCSACWEEDPDANFLNRDSTKLSQDIKKKVANVTQGSARRCISEYGPNAGKRRPGVSEDGLSIVSVLSQLVTHNITYTIRRFPNHPLQRSVEITKNNAGGANQTQTTVRYQLYDGDVRKKQFCSYETVKHPGLISFEDSLLSFLGERNGLRHWAVSTKDGRNRLSDYFDTATTFTPHSVHQNRLGQDFSETRCE